MKPVPDFDTGSPFPFQGCRGRYPYRGKKVMHMATRSRSRSRAHWYPDWVFSIREDITRRNMDLYDRQQEQITARCHEIAPGYRDLHPADQYKIWKQARHDLHIT